MPKEINRALTDRIADFLFTTERDANKNLERYSKRKDIFDGDVMIDTLMKNRKKAEEMSNILKKLGLEKENYAILTLRMAEINVDKKEVLANILSAIDKIQENIRIVYLIHPRTNKRIVGTDKKRIIEESIGILQGKSKKGRIPELWDGKAAERIIHVLRNNIIGDF